MDVSLKDLVEKVRVGETTVLEIAGGEKERKLTVEMRKLLPEEPRPPKRAESPAKNHTFFTASGLADYLDEYGSDKTVIFVDAAGEAIYAVIDETAKDGFEVVTMKPQIHPLWAPWAKIAGATMTVEAFAQHIDQHRRSISAPDPRELRLMLSQIRASVSVEIERGRGKSAVNGLMVKTKIQGVEKNEEVELPDEITVKVPLYVGTELIEVPLDLTIEANRDGDVYVLVSAGTVLDAKVYAFEQMAATLRERSDVTGATFAEGRPAHRDWSYLRELEAK